ncbi:hypothetical protein KJ654_03230 [Patescibacteria group bacterium]|nr:hypothetical protein [Patescibacteria group bacterium]
MTDSPTQTPANTQQKSGAKQKSPLDILEDVLEDAKGAVKNKQDQAEAEDQQRQQQELLVLREQQQTKEAEQIKEQLQKMQEIGKTPAGQARQAQEQAKEARLQKSKLDQEGYKIRQLGHAKV